MDSVIKPSTENYYAQSVYIKSIIFRRLIAQG